VPFRLYDFRLTALNSDWANLELMRGRSSGPPGTPTYEQHLPNSPGLKFVF
jgi:hypothetical protein